ncbi:MAG: PaaI family thioesterase, partial [Thermodesulfobacteriota bacterium]
MDNEEDRLHALREDAVRGFTAHCGLESVSLEPGRFVTRVTIRDCHLQQDGFVHAGVIATMADHTAGYASFSLVPPDRRILTVEYKINFLVPAS